MSEKKWMCSQCTYLNWDASLKCVLCGNDNKIEDQLNQEIYNLSLSQNKSLTSYDSKSKWPCSACTYLNWPKARKCIQCSTIRSKHSSPALSHNSSSDEQVIQQKSHNKEPTKKSNEIKASTNDAPVSQEIKSKDGQSESFNMSKALQKWCCVVCTYENWPKSRICIMCQSARFSDNSSNETNKHSENISENPSARGKKNNADRHSIDLLWLEACTSILSGNLYAFENYLLAVHGQIDRKLTVQECRILNQPEIYTPGLSLIDLAFKMGREDFIELCLANSTSQNTGKALQITKRNSGSRSTSPSYHNPTSTSTGNKIQPIQRMPCHASPEYAVAIRAHLADTIRTRKGDFPCLVVAEHSTFWLPCELELLEPVVKQKLLEELVDQNVMRELEECVDEPQVINWWNGGGSHNRLLALWNRTAGDCLLDSVLQASWAILDRDNVLRTALADSMREAQHIFYPRWRYYEYSQARAFNYTINELQYRSDWQNLLRIACQQGEPLEQIHIFVLSHILRRPIIVYGVKYINNHRNEPVGFAHFQGVYLPLLWDKSYCSRNPIVLGYTRGHFSALVPSETAICLLNPHNQSAVINDKNRGASSHHHAVSINSSHIPPLITGTNTSSNPVCAGFGGTTAIVTPRDPGLCEHPGSISKRNRVTNKRNNQRYPSNSQQASNYQQPMRNPGNNSSNPVCLLPLYDVTKQLLPIHFLSEDESHHSETLLRDWLDVVVTRRGFLMARMRCPRRHPLVNDLIENWLDLYRDPPPYFLENDEDEDDEDEEEDYEESEERGDGGGRYYVERTRATTTTTTQLSRQTTPPTAAASDEAGIYCSPSNARRHKSVSPSSMASKVEPRPNSPHTY